MYKDDVGSCLRYRCDQLPARVHSLFHRSCQWPRTGCLDSRPQPWHPATTRRRCRQTASGRPGNTAKPCTGETQRPFNLCHRRVADESQNCSVLRQQTPKLIIRCPPTVSLHVYSQCTVERVHLTTDWISYEYHPLSSNKPCTELKLRIVERWAECKTCRMSWLCSAPKTHFQTAFPHCQHTAIRWPLHSCQVLGLSLKMLWQSLVSFKTKHSLKSNMYVLFTHDSTNPAGTLSRNTLTSSKHQSRAVPTQHFYFQYLTDVSAMRNSWYQHYGWYVRSLLI